MSAAQLFVNACQATIDAGARAGKTYYESPLPGQISTGIQDLWKRYKALNLDERAIALGLLAQGRDQLRWLGDQLKTGEDAPELLGNSEELAVESEVAGQLSGISGGFADLSGVLDLTKDSEDAIAATSAGFGADLAEAFMTGFRKAESDRRLSLD